MKKIFVSLPMSGRPKDEVLTEMAALFMDVELIYSGEECKLIDTYSNDNLGESISQLLKADVVMFAHEWKDAKGCQVERQVCDLYDIPYWTYGGADIRGAAERGKIPQHVLDHARESYISL